MKKNRTQNWKVACVAAAMLLWPAALFAGPNKTEAELIQMLKSDDYRDVNDALDRLPAWYPKSTNAIPEVKKLLIAKRSDPANVPENFISRRAARSLGNYHVRLSTNELKIVVGFLHSHDEEEVMDGLKALRNLDVPPELHKKIANEIVPLLQDKDDHVVRDACRTLAVYGDKSNIPQIEPLMKRLRVDVRTDARKAIEALKKKG